LRPWRIASWLPCTSRLTPTLSLLLIHLVPAVDRTTQNNIFNIAGALYAATLFLGVSNSSSVQVTQQDGFAPNPNPNPKTELHGLCTSTEPPPMGTSLMHLPVFFGQLCASHACCTTSERILCCVQPVTSIQRAVFYRERSAGGSSLGAPKL